MENWFKHDSTAHADAKLLQLLIHDKAYYANYWLTLEWLFLLEDATASDKELSSLFYFLRETKEYTQEFISLCCDIGLFVKKENTFYSVRLCEQKQKQTEKSAKAKQSIARRWENRNTNVIRTYDENNTNVIQNRIEENRIEESTKVDLSNDTVPSVSEKQIKPTEPKEYGNKHVNFIIDTLKEQIRVKTLDGSVKGNRFAAMQLWKKALKEVEETDAPEDNARTLIQRAIARGVRDDWHRARLNSVSYLQKNFLTLYQLSQ